ncbi:MAG: PfkB family carbohydrate kinase, partial [Sciscionella sp.]
ADELRAATGIAEAGAAARNLCHRGAGAVYASLGANGILGCTAQGTWRLAAPRCAVVNPTGAGDAAVAAIATGIAEGLPTPMVITRAVAWSAAAVVQPQAGVIDPRVVDAHLAVLAAPTEVR